MLMVLAFAPDGRAATPSPAVGAATEPAVQAQHATPMEVVRRSNEEVLEAFGDAERLDSDGEDRVYSIMNEYTDFEALSGAALDDVCDAAEQPRCADLKETFSELLRVSSIKKMGRYRADRFEYAGEHVDGTNATVSTTAHYGERVLPLEYELARDDTGRWRVINYTLNRVNTVRVYRKQFLRLFNQESLEEVIARLQVKINEHRQGTAASPCQGAACGS
jgi:ABC-type transporter MlaC component